MADFQKTLETWGTDSFEETLKRDLTQLGLDELPLQQALRLSSYALDSSIETTILKYTGDTQSLVALIGIFFTGSIAGCHCADDPTTIEELREYCEIELTINRLTGLASIRLLD